MEMSQLNKENQVPAYPDTDVAASDVVLQQIVHQLVDDRHAARQQQAALATQAEQLHSDDVQHWAQLANTGTPQLQRLDAWGNSVNAVYFQQAWHELMALGFQYGLHNGGWAPGPHAHLFRATHFYVHGQVESGTLCPLTMTHAAIPLLREQAASPLASFIRAVDSRQYDPADKHWSEKASVMVGMGLTEKQGGSDLRTNESRANLTDSVSVDGSTQHYRVRGHKWFFSSPMSDAHLVLARYMGELCCFFVPRWLAPGEQNGIHIVRLKDKLGNRSNASAEVEFNDAVGIMLGEVGRGIATLVRMASLTRLDCVLGSAALLRGALRHATHYAIHRKAFGQTLIHQPLMRLVLADLALESEAATTLAMVLAAAMDKQDSVSQAYLRILTPAAKFWVCKRTIAMVAECAEVLGGNGYIETFPLARAYREAPVNAIWEGSGNVMGLDVIRALSRTPELADALWEDLTQGLAEHPALIARVRQCQQVLKDTAEGQQYQARWVSSQLAWLAQAVCLRRYSPDWVFETFINKAQGFDGGLLGVSPISETVQARFIQRAWV